MKFKAITSFIALIGAAQIISTGNVNATMVDLTGAGSSGTILGALFAQTSQTGQGTGVFSPFLRVQATPPAFEQGYNTDGAPLPFDTKGPAAFTHSLLLSSLLVINISGTDYFQFTLDAAQTSGTFTLSQLQLYTSNNPSQTTTTFNPDGTLPLGNLAYNMNPGGGTTNSVLTNATGNGTTDAFVYVPVSFFNLSDLYVILYFAADGTGSFEEWAATVVPELSTLFPVIGLMVAVFSTHALRRRKLMQLARQESQ